VGGRGRRWNRRSLIIVNCAYEYSHYLTCVLITARYNFALRYLTWITSSIYHYSVFHVYYTAALCYIPSRPPRKHTHTHTRACTHCATKGNENYLGTSSPSVRQLHTPRVFTVRQRPLATNGEATSYPAGSRGTLMTLAIATHQQNSETIQRRAAHPRGVSTAKR